MFDIDPDSFFSGGGSLVYERYTPLSSQKWLDPSLQQPMTPTRSYWFLTRISRVKYTWNMRKIQYAWHNQRVFHAYFTREIRIKIRVFLALKAGIIWASGLILWGNITAGVKLPEMVLDFRFVITISDA